MAAAVAPDDTVTVQLHKREKKQYWGHPGICTVTFCKGDAKAARAALQPKMLEVLRANPWVAGQFNAKKELVHPGPSSVTQELVNEVLLPVTKCAAINRSKPYPQLVKAVATDPKLAVQNGSKTRNSKSRVTKFVIVEPEEPGGEFAMIFSMSHVAADGHDYYNIYNMLVSTSVSVVPTNPVRLVEYEAQESQWTGKRDFDWLSGGGGLIKGLLGGLCCGPKSQWCCYTVDTEKIAAKKKEAAAASEHVEYVSTNDIITSHFSKAARARVCMMVVNMRTKISLDLTLTHAGCYEGCLLLDEANYSSPAGIRRCLNAGVPFTRQDEATKPLPGICGSCPMAFITSWARAPLGSAGAAAIELDGVTEQVLHLPCMDMPDMMDVSLKKLHFCC